MTSVSTNFTCHQSYFNELYWMHSHSTKNVCVCVFSMHLDLESPSLEAPDGKELVITEEQLLQIGNQSDPSASNGYFFSKMRNKISQMKSVLCLLEPTGEESNDCFSQSDHLEKTPKVITLTTRNCISVHYLTPDH